MKIQINNETIKLDQQLDSWLIKILEKKAKETRNVKLTSSECINIASETYNIPVWKMKSKARQSEIVEARFYAMYLIKRHTHLSLNQIGLLFNRDHATTLNAVRRFNERLETKQTLIKGLKIDFENN